MPDWNALVRKRLDLSGFSAQQQTEIVAEPAAHLEDLFVEYRSQGLSEAAAIERAQSELSARNLARNIHRATREKGSMNSRTKQLLLPGLIGMIVSIVAPVLLLWAVQWFRFHSFGDGAPHVAIRGDFLFAYLFGGAAGAYLCRRAGGTRLSRIAVALLPAAVYFCCVVLVLSSGLIEPGHFITGAGFGRAMYQAVLQPAALLLLGALAFLIPGRHEKPTTMS